MVLCGEGLACCIGPVVARLIAIQCRMQSLVHKDAKCTFLENFALCPRGFAICDSKTSGAPGLPKSTWKCGLGSHADAKKFSDFDDSADKLRV